MSEENVEIVRRGYEAFAGGNIDELLDLMHPDVEWTPVVAPLLGVEPVLGKEALRRFLTEDVPQSFDDFQVTPKSLEDLGDAVLVRTHYFGRGQTSGVPVSFESFSLVFVRNGKVVSYRDYETRGDALKAAGLSE